jgi:hypothetical protein
VTQSQALGDPDPKSGRSAHRYSSTWRYLRAGAHRHTLDRPRGKGPAQ